MNNEANGMDSMPSRQRTFLAKHGYVVKNLLGKGAFGRVHRVWDERREMYLACKVACGLAAREILRREGVLQSHITHPLFVRYEDCLEDGECTMLLMEYVEGENLAQRLKRRPLTQKQAVAIAIQLAQGIGYLHELPDSILYRDLKPENICLTGAGKVRLMDLGCACGISEAQFSKAGSPGYAPWEQMADNMRHEGVPTKVSKNETTAGEAVASPGFYSDVYALGKLLYYMVTGDDPCKPPLQKPPVRAFDRKLSPLLEQVIVQCIEERPELRPPDMKCVLRMLKPLEAEEMGERVALKRKELVALINGVLTGRRDSGFVYERNVCCSAMTEEENYL